MLTGVLIIVGSAGVWRTMSPIGWVVETKLGIEMWQGNLALVGGIAVLFAAAVGLRSIKLEWVEVRRPLSIASLGAIGGLLALLGALSSLAEIAGAMPALNVSIGWGIPLTLLASLLAIYVAYELYRAESPAIPRGLSV